MPCAQGLLAPNMSALASQAVKHHMRNAHFTGEADPRKPTRLWQLYNHCSHGYVQMYYKTVNARGKPGSKCLSKWSFWGLSGPCGGGGGATRAARERRTHPAVERHVPKCIVSADFKVVSDTFGGRVRLQHALSGRYLCFNRRRRLTVRVSLCSLDAIMTDMTYDGAEGVAKGWREGGDNERTALGEQITSGGMHATVVSP